MLEQELASVMHYTLDKAGNPSPYYYQVPQDFLVPAVFFPPPEVTTRGDTLSTYAIEYTLFVKLFHSSTPLAFAMGMDVLTAIQSNRRSVPLIDEAGSVTGQGFRIKDPELKAISNSDGSVQLILSWDSPRPYIYPQVPKMLTYNLDMHSKDAFRAAVNRLNGATE